MAIENAAGLFVATIPLGNPLRASIESGFSLNGARRHCSPVQQSANLFKRSDLVAELREFFFLGAERGSDQLL